MKVLFLTHSFPRFATDPVGSFVLRLAVALAPLGVEVRVLAPGAPGLGGLDRFEGITVERFRYAPRRLETLAYTGTMRQQVAASWSARLALGGLLAAGYAHGMRSCREFGPDLVHAHWWFPGGLVGRWLRREGLRPLVTTLHGSDLRLAEGSALGASLMRGVLNASDAVTAVSSWLAEAASALAPGVVPAVVPMPVHTDLFPAGAESGRTRLLFVGKLNPQKGSEYLFRALARMRQRLEVDIVVGIGSDEAAARARATELGIADRLRWHPLLPQIELARLYRGASALVMPATDEGLGLVAVEAQLSGTPVVGFRSGGLPDVVAHEATGLLVAPRDDVALAAALDRVVTQPEEAMRWGREGRRRALERFAPEAAARSFRQIYDRVLTGAGR